MGARLERVERPVYVTRVARRSGIVRVLRELGVVGSRPATREAAQEFRQEVTELILAADASITAAQTVAIREALAKAARAHGWME